MDSFFGWIGGELYVLPEGFTLGVTHDGQPAIYDLKNNHVGLYGRTRVCLVTSNGMVKLKKYKGDADA